MYVRVLLQLYNCLGIEALYNNTQADFIDLKGETVIKVQVTGGNTLRSIKKKKKKPRNVQGKIYIFYRSK